MLQLWPGFSREAWKSPLLPAKLQGEVKECSAPEIQAWWSTGEGVEEFWRSSGDPGHGGGQTVTAAAFCAPVERDMETIDRLLFGFRRFLLGNQCPIFVFLAQDGGPVHGIRDNDNDKDHSEAVSHADWYEEDEKCALIWMI